MPSKREGPPPGSRPVAPADPLALARGERWLPDPLVATVEEAATFLDQVGWAVLFPAERVIAPSLWEAVAGPDEIPFAAGMGPAEERVWAWKDELPSRGAAWYGKFVHKRASLLSPDLLAALYPGAGEPTDHEALDLPAEAHQIAEALLTGPLTSAALREVIGDRGRYDRAMTALQRQLLVTSAGTQAQRAGWAATVIDLTCRRFDVGGGPDYGQATARFVDTMISTTAAELARAFGWPTAIARERLVARLP
jgi:hypothetical protein